MKQIGLIIPASNRMVAQEMVRAHPDAVQRFVRSRDETAAYGNAHHAETAPVLGTSITPALLTETAPRNAKRRKARCDEKSLLGRRFGLELRESGRSRSQ